MSYIDDNLMPGETVTYREKLHWIVFVWPAVVAVAAILFSGEVGLVVFLWLVAITFGTEAIINYSTSEFGVTNKRVIVKTGFVSRKSLEILLMKVEGIQVNQGIFGRMLGYGSLVVTGTGGSKNPLHKVNSPFEFRKKIQEQVDAVQG